MKPANGILTEDQLESMYKVLAFNRQIMDKFVELGGGDCLNLYIAFEYAKRWVRLGEQSKMTIDMPDLKEGQCCWRDHNRDGNCDIHAYPGILRKGR